MESIDDWQQLMLWASGLSVAAVIVAMASIPWVVGRLPANYFSSRDRLVWHDAAGAPVYTGVVTVLKNLLGLVLVPLGIVMLVTPGQGLLTLLAGLLLLNFPGKYRLECWLVSQPGVLRALNWLRHRRGEPPFEPPPHRGLPRE